MAHADVDAMRQREHDTIALAEGQEGQEATAQECELIQLPDTG